LSGNAELDKIFEKIKVRKIKRLTNAIRGRALQKLQSGKFTKADAITLRDQIHRQYQQKMDRLRDKYKKRTIGKKKTPPFLDNIYKITIDESVSQITACSELQTDPDILYAEPDFVVMVDAVPNDYYYHQKGSWGVTGLDDLWGLKIINMESAWNGYTGKGVTVAVIDTGIDYEHEDIAANMWKNPGEVDADGKDNDGNGYIDDIHGYDFYNLDSSPKDDSGHGTHVAGTIAATGNNEIGIVGVAYDARVMALKCFNKYGTGRTSAIANAITYAVDKGADIINNSWGGPGTSALIKDVINYAQSVGSIVVCSAGNDYTDANFFFPANMEGVITVGAVYRASSDYYPRSSYSNYGVKIDVYAPGGRNNTAILSLLAEGSYFESSKTSSIVGGKYIHLTGTSMAAPHVSGLIALLLEKTPSLSTEQVRYIIRTSAQDLGDDGWEDRYSFGLIDAAASVYMGGIIPRLHAFISAPSYGLDYPHNFITKGDLEVLGWASGDDFFRYDIAYAPYESWNSVPFTTIYEDELPKTDDVLATIDTSGWANGKYFLRLRVYNAIGEYSDALTTFTIDSAAKTGWPRLNSPYWMGPPPEWRSPETDRDSLTFADLNGDQFKETISTSENYLYVRDSEGRSMPGFPIHLPGIYRISSAPTIADLDHDGDNEIILVAEVRPDGQPLFAFHHDGTPVNGFPAGNPDPNIPSYVAIISSPYPAVAADLTGDNQKEIVFATGTYNVNYAYTYLVAVNALGMMQPGFPVIVSSGDGGWYLDFHKPRTAISVSDLDGNGKKEILIGRDLNTAQAELVIYNYDGSMQNHAIFDAGSRSLNGFPVADWNNDGNKEILFFVRLDGECYAHLTDISGGILPGWPQHIPYRHPKEGYILCDIDADNEIELVSIGGPNLLWVYAHNFDGTMVNGFPFELSANLGILPFLAGVPLVVGDLEESSGPALFAGDYEFGLFGFDTRGTYLSNWPKPVLGTQGSPAVADLDNDGKLDIGFRSYDGFVHIWEEPAPSFGKSRSEWATTRGNNRRTNEPFVPELAFLEHPWVFFIGHNNSITLGWNFLPSDDDHTITLELKNALDEIAGMEAIEPFDETGILSVEMNVNTDASLDIPYQLVARSISNTSLEVVAEQHTENILQIRNMIPGDLDLDADVDGVDLSIFARQIAEGTNEITITEMSAHYGMN
jgi:subtilisin family serine protease